MLDLSGFHHGVRLGLENKKIMNINIQSQGKKNFSPPTISRKFLKVEKLLKILSVKNLLKILKSCLQDQLWFRPLLSMLKTHQDPSIYDK